MPRSREGNRMHADGTQPHVLAVNDSPELLDLFRELFDEECFRVTTWSERDTTFDDIVHLAPDLIILDYSIGVEGVLLLQLTESPLTSHMPIILCTGVVRDEDDAVWKLLNAMGVKVVFKPFDIDHFLRVVREALRLDSG
jgi:two-component system sensor histidine kinase/response regulator